ncbi:hypothetical protein RKD19_002824 [Streptomyces canus]
MCDGTVDGRRPLPAHPAVGDGDPPDGDGPFVPCDHDELLSRRPDPHVPVRAVLRDPDLAAGTDVQGGDRGSGGDHGPRPGQGDGAGSEPGAVVPQPVEGPRDRPQRLAGRHVEGGEAGLLLSVVDVRPVGQQPDAVDHRVGYGRRHVTAGHLPGPALLASADLEGPQPVEGHPDHEPLMEQAPQRLAVGPAGVPGRPHRLQLPPPPPGQPHRLRSPVLVHASPTSAEPMPREAYGA